MLDRNRRLRQTRDINRVYAKGHYGNAAGLSVKALKNNLTSSRAAVVVSRKVSKKAVVRNRIKRRVREAVRMHLDRLNPQWSIVINPRRKALDASTQDLQREVERLFLRCNGS